MQKLILPLLILSSVYAYAQPDEEALENIVIETYYISGEGDVDQMPVGSVTYRVYADLKPGYKVQQVFGNPVHPMSISTSSEFYNSDFGVTFGSNFLTALLNFNTAALDSYVSIGGVSQQHFGIEKSLDPDASSILGITPPYLQNDDPLAGTPLTQTDGFIENMALPISQIGLDTELGDSFGLVTTSTPFETDNGAWFNLNGVEGPTEENQVLIGQFTTTDGSLNFCLNIQVIIPEDLITDNRTSIQFVAVSDPSDEEINADPSSGFAVYQKDALCDDFVVSVPEISSSEFLTVYPNPAISEFSLQTKENLTNVRLSLFDVTGKVVMQKQMNQLGSQNFDVFDITHLNPGVYLFLLESDQGSYQNRVVKANQ